MHELSVAQSIVDLVQDHVPEQDRPLVRSVRIKVGTQAGIVVDSLQFSFQAITAGTPLAAARLEVEEVPFRLTCRDCNTVSNPDLPLVRCPHCGSSNTAVTAGTEMTVTELELDDAARSES